MGLVTIILRNNNTILQNLLYYTFCKREKKCSKIYLTVLQPLKARQVHLRFGQMEENSRSHGNAWHAFIRRWGDPSMLQATCYDSRVPTPLYTKGTQSWQNAKILYNKAWFCACETNQGYENTAYRAHSQGYGNTASLSCPDIRVREPDWLHLPYRWVGWGAWEKKKASSLVH